ncbi:unnamed protein product [Amoebophrya sp. A25]|nr:unnamed protein product [Amoebophrya sp. A25]|eukprot:GSA25T00018929001.1
MKAKKMSWLKNSVSIRQLPILALVVVSYNFAFSASWVFSVSSLLVHAAASGSPAPSREKLLSGAINDPGAPGMSLLDREIALLREHQAARRSRLKQLEAELAALTGVEVENDPKEQALKVVPKQTTSSESIFSEIGKSSSWESGGTGFLSDWLVERQRFESGTTTTMSDQKEVTSSTSKRVPKSSPGGHDIIASQLLSVRSLAAATDSKSIRIPSHMLILLERKSSELSLGFYPADTTAAVPEDGSATVRALLRLPVPDTSCTGMESVFANAESLLILRCGVKKHVRSSGKSGGDSAYTSEGSLVVRRLRLMIAHTPSKGKDDRKLSQREKLSAFYPLAAHLNVTAVWLRAGDGVGVTAENSFEASAKHMALQQVDDRVAEDASLTAGKVTGGVVTSLGFVMGSDATNRVAARRARMHAVFGYADGRVSSMNLRDASVLSEVVPLEESPLSASFREKGRNRKADEALGIYFNSTAGAEANTNGDYSYSYLTSTSARPSPTSSEQDDVLRGPARGALSLSSIAQIVTHNALAVTVWRSDNAEWGSLVIREAAPKNVSKHMVGTHCQLALMALPQAQREGMKSSRMPSTSSAPVTPPDVQLDSVQQSRSEDSKATSISEAWNSTATTASQGRALVRFVQWDGYLLYVVADIEVPPNDPACNSSTDVEAACKSSQHLATVLVETTLEEMQERCSTGVRARRMWRLESVPGKHEQVGLGFRVKNLLPLGDRQMLVLHYVEDMSGLETLVGYHLPVGASAKRAGGSLWGASSSSKVSDFGLGAGTSTPTSSSSSLVFDDSLFANTRGGGGYLPTTLAGVRALPTLGQGGRTLWRYQPACGGSLVLGSRVSSSAKQVEETSTGETATPAMKQDAPEKIEMDLQMVSRATTGFGDLFLLKEAKQSATSSTGSVATTTLATASVLFEMVPPKPPLYYVLEETARAQLLQNRGQLLDPTSLIGADNAAASSGLFGGLTAGSSGKADAIESTFSWVGTLRLPLMFGIFGLIYAYKGGDILGIKGRRLRGSGIRGAGKGGFGAGGGNPFGGALGGGIGGSFDFNSQRTRGGGSRPGLAGAGAFGRGNLTRGSDLLGSSGSNRSDAFASFRGPFG